MDDKFYEEMDESYESEYEDSCEDCDCEEHAEREQTFGEKLRSRTIVVLQRILSSPRVWYVAGLIDAVIVIYLAKKFL